jgi:sucrose phosphorylase
LTRWAESLSTPSNQTTFFNFLASHDGIGLTPARALLSDAEISAVAERVQALGGRVSFKTNPDGSQSPYELNINDLDALAHPDQPDPNIEHTANRFLTSQAIMLAMPGVPGIYFHSLFGSRGWPEGVEQTGRFRTINRQKLPVDQLQAELNTPNTLRHHVFTGYKQLLKIRANSAVFHPNGPYEILDLNSAVFAIQRHSPDQTQHILCLQNVSSQPQPFTLETLTTAPLADLISGRSYSPTFSLRPYQTLWLNLS